MVPGGLEEGVDRARGGAVHQAQGEVDQGSIRCIHSGRGSPPASRARVRLPAVVQNSAPASSATWSSCWIALLICSAPPSPKKPQRDFFGRIYHFPAL
jgi:hypothetical protein